MKKFHIHKDTIIVPSLLVLLIWVVFLVQSVFNLHECYGIVPLNIKGLRGIILSPLFHGSLQHILSNTVPLFILTALLFQFYETAAYFVLVAGWIASGVIVWLLPDFAFMGSSLLSCHIGASGVVYVLAFFLFFSGVFRKERALMAISLIVVFLYGGIVWGMFPQEILGIKSEAKISWESHLSGGLVGIVLAYMLRKIGRRSNSIKQVKPDDAFTYTDEELWEQYKTDYPDYFPEEVKKQINQYPTLYNYEYKDDKKEKGNDSSPTN